MLGILALLTATGVIAAAAIANRNARLRVIEEGFRALGGDPVRAHGGVEGPIGGHVTHYAIFARRQQPLRPDDLPAHALDPAAGIRDGPPPETRSEQRDVERGRAIDLVLGDKAFNNSFIVEAAPPRSHGPCSTSAPARRCSPSSRARWIIAGDEVHFSKYQALGEPAEVRRVLELCVHLGSSLEALPSQLHERRPARPATARRRATRARAGSDARPGDELRDRQRARYAASDASAAKAIALVQGAVFVVLGVLVWLFIATRHR